MRNKHKAKCTLRNRERGANARLEAVQEDDVNSRPRALPELPATFLSFRLLRNLAWHEIVALELPRRRSQSFFFGGIFQRESGEMPEMSRGKIVYVAGLC